MYNYMKPTLESMDYHRRKTLVEKWRHVLDQWNTQTTDTLAILLANQERLGDARDVVVKFPPSSGKSTLDPQVYEAYALPLIRKQFPVLLSDG